MPFAIRDASQSDVAGIQALYRSLGRPPRDSISLSEMLVAIDADALVGCAGVTLFAGGGYLYGLAVAKSQQRKGIGSALTAARLERVRKNGHLAVVMAMFWNVRFFKRLGFNVVKKSSLPPACGCLTDFNRAVYRRSTVLAMFVGEPPGTCVGRPSGREWPS